MKTGQDSSVSVAVKRALFIQNLPCRDRLSFFFFLSPFLFHPFLLAVSLGFELGLLDWRTGRGYLCSALYCLDGVYINASLGTLPVYPIICFQHGEAGGLGLTGWDGTGSFIGSESMNLN